MKHVIIGGDDNVMYEADDNWDDDTDTDTFLLLISFMTYINEINNQQRESEEE